jgi:hypothetical protein
MARSICSQPAPSVASQFFGQSKRAMNVQASEKAEFLQLFKFRPKRQTEQSSHGNLVPFCNNNISAGTG